MPLAALAVSSILLGLHLEFTSVGKEGNWNRNFQHLLAVCITLVTSLNLDSDCHCRNLCFAFEGRACV